MWQIQQQVGCHMACAPFVNVVERKIRKQRTRVCWKKITMTYSWREAYQTKDHSSTLVKNFEKRLSLSHREEYNCAFAHCSGKNTVENFDGHVHDRRCLGQICFPQEFYQRYLKLAVTVLVSVRAGCVELIAKCFGVRDRRYLSVWFIFRISKATKKPPCLMVLCGWEKFELTSVGPKIFNSFMDFSQTQKCRR